MYKQKDKPARSRMTFMLRGAIGVPTSLEASNIVEAALDKAALEQDLPVAAALINQFIRMEDDVPVPGEAGGVTNSPTNKKCQESDKTKMDFSSRGRGVPWNRH